MQMLTVRNDSRGMTLGAEIELADGPWSRLKGLLGRRGLDAGQGMLLTRCKGVHMWGMKFAIDVVFLDTRGTVVAAYPGLAPGERTPIHRGACFALELPAGTLKATGTATGDVLDWEAA